MVAFAVIVFAHILVIFISSRNIRFYRLVTSPERLWGEDGKFAQKNLQREWIHPETLQSELRTLGEEHAKEVKEA
jgi:uncharacterized membrane protein YcaP (DUF421 family)